MLFPAFLLKFRFGYEYATAVVLAPLAPLVYCDLSRQARWRGIVESFVCVMAPAILAFACAIALHAVQISHHGKDGLREIVFLATKRLHADDPQAVAAVACAGAPAAHIAECREAYVRSLDASTPVVLAAYAGMIAVAAIAPISWLVLAKAHSYAHQHLNFVLWTLPFVPFLAGCLVALMRAPPGRA